MPYTRRFNKRRGFKTARRFRKPFRRMITQQRRRFIKNTIYRMADNKYIHNNWLNTIENDGIWYSSFLNNLVTGPGESERLGNKVRTNWFSFNMNLTWEPGALPTRNYADVRVMVIWPKFNYAEFSTYLTSTNFGLENMIDKRMAFVWFDQRFRIVAPGFGSPDEFKNVKFYKKFRANIEFLNDGETIPRISPLIVIRSNGTTDDKLRFRGYYKTSFIDI